MRETIDKILSLFNRGEKKKLLILLLMMIFAAFFETLGIGLIVPFVGIVTNPEIIQEQVVLSFLYETLQFQSPSMFMIFSVVLLLTIFVLKNLYLLFFQYTQYRVILNQQVQLSIRLFREYLTKPYTFHLQRNSAELLRNVNSEVPMVFQGIILSSFQLFTEFLVIGFVFTLLLITVPMVTITASLFLGGSVLIFLKIMRAKVTSLGKEQQMVNREMIQWVNQGLGASKEVKVSGKENFFINSYTKYSQIRANNSRYMKMLDQVPRLFVETLFVSVVLIIMLVIILQGKTTENMISIMALFTMAAFRLMPSINRIVALITTIRYSKPALTVIHEDLFKNIDSTLETSNLLEPKWNELSISEKSYQHSIQLHGIFFRYPGQQEYSIKDVSLTIPIGYSVAFVGESGAGKTTLMDIVLGLLHPEKGQIMVDGKDLYHQKSIWQKRIGYIPQSIFLTDDTIRANVAFGIEKGAVDDAMVWRALEQAQLKEFIESLPDQLDTKVGEDGVRLSGGQRQRIGIARALYPNPEILFMDEATSALDNETENEIMQAIDGLKGDKTMIIIAHRLSTIKNCDIVFRIHKGKLETVTKNMKMPAI